MAGTNVYGLRQHFDHITLKAQKEVRFADSDSSNFAAIKAPATLSADYTLTLPVDDGTSGQVLSTDGSGVLSWASALTATLASQNVFIGNGSNVATATDTSALGDISATTTGGLEIKAGVIVNADINASAAIAFSKLAALTASRALTSDGSGVVSVSSVTSTELGYVSGVTSAIQTQIDGKASTALSNLASVAINTSLVSDTDNTDDLGSSAITWRRAYLKTGLVLQESGAGTDAITISAPAALAASYSLTLPTTDGAASQVLETDGSGVLSWSSRGYAADWANADGATKSITHSLGTTDVIVQLFDAASGESIEIDSITRSSSSVVDLVASQAPAVTWRVLVSKIV